METLGIQGSWRNKGMALNGVICPQATYALQTIMRWAALLPNNQHEAWAKWIFAFLRWFPHGFCPLVESRLTGGITLMDIWLFPPLVHYEKCCCEHLYRSLVWTWTRFSFSWLHIKEWSYIVIICLNIMSRLFSKVAVMFYTPPATFVWGARFLYISTLGNICCFDDMF